ncbi:MAG: hypothetical protein IKI18_05775 [Prevotella sp.]|nr:hypothetical protein [Prevotella sp.]
MIKFSDGGKHIYTYDASGRKLRAEHHVPVMVAAEPQIPIEDWLEPIEILEQPYEEPQIPDDAVQMPEEQPLDWGFEHMQVMQTKDYCILEAIIQIQQERLINHRIMAYLNQNGELYIEKI